MDTIQIEYPTKLPDYALLDSGDGEKLETFSGYTVIRPDPRALWQKSQKEEMWNTADARYIRTSSEYGSWNIKRTPPDPWHFHYKDYSFLLHPTDFKHVGIFPEQAVNWEWMTTQINRCHPELVEGSRIPTQDSCWSSSHPLHILNLFAYTGAATVIAAKTGAFVTHVDSVKSTISWANENVRLNKIPTDRVRWIEDDAYKFVTREAKREQQYDAIIMDPPRFGRGAKGEVWKLEEDLPKLLLACKQILSPNPLFVLINAYTADLSSLVLSHLMHDLMKEFDGTITFGELATKEASTDRLLPQGVFTRWQC
ncbi:class I SAM-dependent methyltransferase [Patescibacteria group bacterium]|nr:class I SAM-dependent methyltransferase [Patescibacteria group bacterium]